MADHGQHQIVVGRVHLIDVGSHRLPQAAQALDGLGGRLFGGRQQAPAVLKERGKARPGAGMFGPGKRVGGDKGHAFGDMGADRGDHRLFHGPHISNAGPLGKMRADLGRDFGHGADGDGQNHQIGALHGFGGGAEHPVTDADLQGHPAGFLGFGIAHDFAHKAELLHGMGHRGGDQPQPDQRHAVINRRGHLAPLNWPMAWATRRQEAASPTVMRRQWGSL